jgi:hypothetical protein
MFPGNPNGILLPATQPHLMFATAAIQTHRILTLAADPGARRAAA